MAISRIGLFLSSMILRKGCSCPIVLSKALVPSVNHRINMAITVKFVAQPTARLNLSIQNLRFLARRRSCANLSTSSSTYLHLAICCKPGHVPAHCKNKLRIKCRNGLNRACNSGISPVMPLTLVSKYRMRQVNISTSGLMPLSAIWVLSKTCAISVAI
ncbi:Uncharacterised protein [Yersinia enterocolitica]|nr:Uncharacterised protein [Yersinia enterocolitica]